MVFLFLLNIMHNFWRMLCILLGMRIRLSMMILNVSETLTLYKYELKRNLIPMHSPENQTAS